MNRLTVVTAVGAILALARPRRPRRLEELPFTRDRPAGAVPGAHRRRAVPRGPVLADAGGHRPARGHGRGSGAARAGHAAARVPLPRSRRRRRAGPRSSRPTASAPACAPGCATRVAPSARRWGWATTNSDRRPWRSARRGTPSSPGPSASARRPSPSAPPAGRRAVRSAPPSGSCAGTRTSPTSTSASRPPSTARARSRSSGRASCKPDDFDEHVEVATAAPGAAFAVQRLGDGVSTTRPPVLVTAPGGWALAGFDGGATGLPSVYERAPGGAFAAVRLPTVPDRPDRERFRMGVALAVREGGGAVIAWSTHAARRRARRRGGDARGGRRVRAGADRRRSGHAGAGRERLRRRRPVRPAGRLRRPTGDADRPDLRAALAPDGRVVLAWTAPAGRRPLRSDVAHAATGRLDGTFDGGAAARGAAARHDRRRAAGARGRPRGRGLDRQRELRPRPRAPRRRGGAAAVARLRRELTLRAPRLQRLFRSQSLRLQARCDGPCDLRAVVARTGWRQGRRGQPDAHARRDPAARRSEPSTRPAGSA